MKKNFQLNTPYMVIVAVFYLFVVTACSNFQHSSHSRSNNSFEQHICNNASALAGQIIGDGHCVSLIKYCSNAPNTNQWRPGLTIWNNNIHEGTIIATFKNGRYPNISGYHAAIYIKQDSDGIWVWDQWQGKAVHKRLIRWRNDDAPDSNTAQSYRTVLSSSY